MNKLIKREFLSTTTQQETNRKRWYATIQCGKCADVFTIREHKSRDLVNKPCETCSKRIIAYHKFIRKAIAKHQNIFDYSLVTEDNYVGLFVEIPILCKLHGVFYQKPKDHISSANAKLCCPTCVYNNNKVKNKRTIVSWKEELHAKAPHIVMVTHGNVDSNREPVELSCSYHGKFTVALAEIKKSKYICALCAQDANSWGGRFRRIDIPGILYFIHIPSLNLWKLGVTSATVKERLKALKIPYELVWEAEFPTLNEAYMQETLLLRRFKNYRRDRKLPNMLGKCKGSSELLTCEIPITALQSSDTLSKEP